MTLPYHFAFGDEAGDTGLKFDRGSSTSFVSAVLLTNDPDNLRAYVCDFRRSLSLRDTGELSFHRTPDRNRITFLQGLAHLNLGAYALIVDKQTLLPELRGLEKLAFYTTFFTALLLRLIPDELEQSTVILDEFGNKDTTIMALRQHLKRAYGGHIRPFVRRLTARRSRSEPALQAADMVAGAVFRYVTQGDARFYEIIEPHTRLWKWTGNEKPPG
ncbi:MAG: hypothetical protein DRI77_07845 [Chloroflexi bacterium]|nr:MAG: hypothetical protein DRI77_07845 [Chloroflexota bacterium]